METILLDEASKLLAIHPQTLLKHVRSGEIPAAKLGKRWVFVKADLIDYIRSKYTTAQSNTSKIRVKNKCYIKEKTANSGGSKSHHPMVENQYEQLLSLKTK